MIMKWRNNILVYNVHPPFSHGYVGEKNAQCLNAMQEYRLMYRVFDDKFANTTTVIIQVLDVNDNAPKFDNAIYNVTDVQEEERGISKNNHKYLLTVCHCFQA